MATAEATAPEVPKKQLKRLGFVAGYVSYAASAAGVAEKAYQGAKTRLAGWETASAYLTKIEDTVVAYAAPALATAEDYGDKLLYAADEQVRAWGPHGPGRGGGASRQGKADALGEVPRPGRASRAPLHRQWQWRFGQGCHCVWGVELPLMMVISGITSRALPCSSCRPSLVRRVTSEHQ